MPDPAAFPARRYDLIQEFVIALVAVALLTAGLAAVLSSPDVRPVTLASWSRAAGPDFTATAVAELAGTSGTAEYGPPDTHTPGAAQKLGPVGLHKRRLRTHPGGHRQRLRHRTPGPCPRTAWRQSRPLRPGPLPRSPAARTGARPTPTHWPTLPAATPPRWPRATTVRSLCSPRAFSTWPDSVPWTESCRGGGKFYETDYTRSLLFLSDGSYLESLARTEHLGGDQWGMMNETGNYPGQAWLWLFTFWYQIEPFKSSGNADALIWA